MNNQNLTKQNPAFLKDESSNEAAMLRKKIADLELENKGLK